jgi:6-phosphogluconolactonase
MRVEVYVTPAAAAARAATLVAERIDTAIAGRGLAAIALSGGKTPVGMFGELASAAIDWPRVHVFQVDERLVGEHDDRRNWRFIKAAFDQSGLTGSQLHAMPLDAASPEAGAHEYASVLRAVAGTPPVLDAVHLGLGEDGHTASLFPGDAAVGVAGEIALSGVHEGMRRMTLTLETINRARARIWLVTGPAKRAIVKRLLEPGAGLIASRVRSDESILVLDHDASATA